MTSSTDTFEALGLPPPLLEALAQLGHTVPTPIQREAIPPLLAGKDVLGQAATGTGKTAAFALPLLARLTPGACGPFQTSALVLVPTRELAMQVAEAVQTYGANLGVTVVAVYGGQEISAQFRWLKRGVDVVVATPGRAIDHLNRKTLKLDRVGTVVLDEADEMLDMGFADDLEIILGQLPKKRQAALFSATLPSRIARIAERHLDAPVRITIARAQVAAGEAPKVRQVAYAVPRKFKPVALARILRMEQPQGALIFCRTRDDVDSLAQLLTEQGFRSEALHGGLTQEQRDRVMRRFKARTVEMLVATDVAARGLHIDSLSHVVNFDVPNQPEAYVHRIGRTGRAGKEGVAISLVEPGEVHFLKLLERATQAKITMSPVPTPTQLRERQLGETQTLVREALAAGGHDAFRAAAEALVSADVDALSVAAAALKLLHEARQPAGASDEAEIPTFSTGPTKKQGPRGQPARGRPNRNEASHAPANHARGRPGKPVATGDASTEQGTPGDAPAPRPGSGHAESGDAKHETGEVHAPGGAAAERPAKQHAAPEEAATGARAKSPNQLFREELERERAAKGKGPSRSGPGPQTGPGAQRQHAGRPGFNDSVRLFIGAGTRAGIRPADLVGAIANEAGVDSRSIRVVEIRDPFSLVEVPAGVAEQVITALRDTTLRGRKVQVRRDRP